MTPYGVIGQERVSILRCPNRKLGSNYFGLSVFVCPSFRSVVLIVHVQVLFPIEPLYLQKAWETRESRVGSPEGKSSIVMC